MTAEVEFIGRFIKRKNGKSEEDREYEKAQKIIHGEDYEESTSREYNYEPIVLDLYAVADFMRLDERHTQVLMKYMYYYILKIQYEDFKLIKQHLTGSMIRNAENFPTKKEVVYNRGEYPL